jgi:hypothetical protein
MPAPRRAGKRKITMDVLTHDGPQGKNKRDRENDIVAEWPANSREMLRVSIGPYKSAWRLDIRKWFTDNDGELKPGNKGISLAIKDLPRLADALASALSVARERGLVGDETHADH